MTQPASQPNDADALFKQMQTVNPIRDDIGDEEVPAENDNGNGEEQSLDERLEGGARKPTDLQIADKRLFPNLGFRHLNVQMMARIFPDSFNALMRMQVKDLLKNSNLRVAEAYAIVNTSLTIPIDGEGRIDEIQIAKQGGISSDEDKSKGGGL